MMNKNQEQLIREYRVGLFAFVALFMLFFGWSWLKGLSIFHPPQRFTVQFHDVAGLNNNAPVNVNGVRVGNVEKLDLKGKGQVLVRLKVNTEDVVIPQGASFTIQTLGLVGAKYVEIRLPEEKPGAPPPAPLDPSSVVIGDDPVRVELILNKVATNISEIDFAGIEDKVTTKMERLAKAADSVQSAAHHFESVADNAKSATQSANDFFKRSTTQVDRLSTVAADIRTGANNFNALAQDWRTTAHRLNRILDNPALSADLRETAEKAKQMATTLQSTIHELNSTLGDKPLREDVLSMLQRLNQSTDNIYRSMQVVHKVAGDEGLRTDLKDILKDANHAMDRVNAIVSEPTFGTDLKGTVDKVKSAATDIDTVAKQMNQILNRKHPLVHMIFGRPGYIKEEKVASKKRKSMTKSVSVGQQASKEGVRDARDSSDKGNATAGDNDLNEAEQKVRGDLPNRSVEIEEQPQ